MQLQADSTAPRPSMNLYFVPAITLTGNSGNSRRLQFINQFGLTDAWLPLTLLFVFIRGYSFLNSVVVAVAGSLAS